MPVIRMAFWPVAGGRWLVAGGWWLVAGGRWLAAGGRWQVAGGRWPVAGGRWPVAGFALAGASVSGKWEWVLPKNTRRLLKIRYRWSSARGIEPACSSRGDPSRSAGLGRNHGLRFRFAGRGPESSLAGSGQPIQGRGPRGRRRRRREQDFKMNFIPLQSCWLERKTAFAYPGFLEAWWDHVVGGCRRESIPGQAFGPAWPRN
jgi:hypothetical protein